MCTRACNRTLENSAQWRNLWMSSVNIRTDNSEMWRGALLGETKFSFSTHTSWIHERTSEEHWIWNMWYDYNNCQLNNIHRLYLTLILLMWRIGWAPNSIPIYIQQDATLHSLFISGNCSTCFGWYFHPSSGANTTVSTASGICHTVTSICRYRGRVGTGLSVLWVA